MMGRGPSLCFYLVVVVVVVVVDRWQASPNWGAASANA